MRVRFLRPTGVLALSAVLFAACAGSDPTDPDPGPDPAGGQPEVVLVAGDIARCTRDGDEQTAALLDAMQGTIIVAGDLTHEHGPGQGFDACYGPSWGRHLSRTWFAFGNHDYVNGSLAAVKAYVGNRAPGPDGYYSLEIGSWLVLILNSNYEHIGTLQGSPQEQWLRAELQAKAGGKCVLAVWHKPRFFHGGPGHINTMIKDFWIALYEAGADVVVNSHHRMYERYAKQDHNGNPDARGIRQFIAGTGGDGFDVMHAASPNVEARNNSTFGVLKLTLKPGSYDWEFVPVAGASFTDSGSGTCN